MKSASELVGPRIKAEKKKKEKMKKHKKPYISNWSKIKLKKLSIKEREKSIGDFNIKNEKGVYFNEEDLKQIDKLNFDFHKLTN